ncbi:hypothetical protein KKF61_08370 [Patescibacteria group bacterium]|nr:hypothetical protein [Patescibacteria group bacterium]
MNLLKKKEELEKVKAQIEFNYFRLMGQLQLLDVLIKEEDNEINPVTTD